MMVSDTDREHFRRIAAIEAQLNDEALRAAALRTPGESIVLGFALSEFAAAFGGDLTHEDEVPLIHLWRAREQRDQDRR